MLRAFASATLLAVALLGLTSCGDDESSGADGADGGTTPTSPAVIEVTFEGGTVTPNGERVTVDVGQPVELEITADEAGEIHVHSDPEQTLDYDEGTSTVTIEALDQPGVVDVESHDLEVIVVQLEVS
jgi:hypothetical protein